MECRWRIIVDKGFYIKLRFTVFDVEFYPNCTYDYLRVIEGHKLHGTYCGSTEKGQSEAISQLKSTGNSIQVLFHSDYSNERNYKGFVAHYTAVGTSMTSFHFILILFVALLNSIVS